MNIDYTYERYFNEEQDSAEYTYLSTYVCPANELVNAYKTKDVLNGEDPFRLLYSPDYLAYDLYTSSDFARNEVTMNSLFGNKSYITENEFFDMYLSDYERCLSKIDTALAEFGTSLSEYGINYNEFIEHCMEGKLEFSNKKEREQERPRVASIFMAKDINGDN